MHGPAQTAATGDTDSGQVSGGPSAGLTPLADFAAEPGMRARWAALLHRSAHPNPFYGPDFLIPLAERLGPGGGLAIAWVRAQSAEGSRLVGLLPVLMPARGALRRTLVALGLAADGPEAFVHPMVVDTTPLLDRDAAVPAAAALVRHLATQAPGTLLRLRFLREGLASEALAEAVASLSLPHAPISRFARAGLAADSAPVAGRRLRDLRRDARRLSEHGTIAFETLTGAGVEAGREAFLALEASGWKGRAGTALAEAPDRLAFAREALSARAAAPAIAIDLMRLDGRPIAASIHLLAGEAGGTFKCAFDEAYARGSPGVQLDAYTARALADGSLPARSLDSCAAPGHPVEGLWPERLGFRDEAILLAPAAEPTRLARLLAGIARRETARATLKRLAKRLLRRKTTAARG